MSIDYSDMAFPKKGKKKKRKVHPPSIIQSKQDKRCLLCVLLDDDHRNHSYLEEHHIMFGAGRRELSEKYGLKCNLCLDHHRDSKVGVHSNQENAEMLMRLAQQRFKKEYPNLDWMQIFGKNYL